MKKKIFVNVLFFAVSTAFGQFKVVVNAPDFSSNDANVEIMEGSKSVFAAKGKKNKSQWVFTLSKPYTGMMKVSFVDKDQTIGLIAENRDVTINVETKNDQIENVTFSDESNLLMNDVQKYQSKVDQVLPTLSQLQGIYDVDTDFGKALNKEIVELSKKDKYDLSNHPFIKYYAETTSKYLSSNNQQNPSKKKELINFMVSSNNYLETSSLMKPVLMTFLNLTTQESLDKDVEELLAAVNIETSRGQTILSELIEIFDTYGLDVYKNKYLAQAKDLKCTINDRLSKTIKVNDNIAIGAKFPNNKFISPKNTKAKSVYEVVADKKIIFFWSSTCSHCENQIPLMEQKYKELKDKKIEIIGLFLDSEKANYENRIKNLPWINDSEGKGWNSSYVETYNVHGTPYFFILDSQNNIVSKPNTFKEALSFLGLE